MFSNLGQTTGAEENVVFPADDYGCVQVFDDYADAERLEVATEQFVRVECTGNVFEDNLCYPVMERSDDCLYTRRGDYVLERNVLRGANGAMTRCEGQLEGANRL